MKKRYHFEPEIMFPKYAQIRDTVTIPKKSDLMIGGNLNKRKALKDWVIARKMAILSNTPAGVEASWDLSEAWAADGRKRKHID